ncbi:MAG: carboxymuconolactone decarboxylase family protein [Steroidobacteraceae bacterium]
MSESGTAQDYHQIYEELIGFTPPRIRERIQLGLECDPELLDQVERIRAKAMYPSCFDIKTTQLMLFGILLGQVLPAAEFHARAACRAGASKQELHAVAGLAFLFRGLPAFNLGAEIINQVFATSTKKDQESGR